MVEDWSREPRFSVTNSIYFCNHFVTDFVTVTDISSILIFSLIISLCKSRLQGYTFLE